MLRKRLMTVIDNLDVCSTAGYFLQSYRWAEDLDT